MGHFASYYKSKLSYVWDADFLAFWARTSGTPDTWKIAYNQLFIDLKNAGIFNKADVIHIFSAHNANDANLNLIKNAHNATSSILPSFTAKIGYTGNGLSSYINNNYNPSVDADKYIISDCAIMAYMYDAFSVGAIMGVYDGVFSEIALSGSIYWSLNNGLSADIYIPTNKTILATRSGNNQALISNTMNTNLFSPYSSKPNGNIYSLSRNRADISSIDLYSSNTISAQFIGAGITASERNAFDAIIDNWFTAISTL